MLIFCSFLHIISSFMPLNKLIKGASHKALQKVPEIGEKKEKGINSRRINYLSLQICRWWIKSSPFMCLSHCTWRVLCVFSCSLLAGLQQHLKISGKINLFCSVQHLCVCGKQVLTLKNLHLRLHFYRQWCSWLSIKLIVATWECPLGGWCVNHHHDMHTMRCSVILTLSRTKWHYRQSQELKSWYPYFCMRLLVHDDASLFYLSVLSKAFLESLSVLAHLHNGMERLI